MAGAGTPAAPPAATAVTNGTDAKTGSPPPRPAPSASASTSSSASPPRPAPGAATGTDLTLSPDPLPASTAPGRPDGSSGEDEVGSEDGGPGGVVGALTAHRAALVPLLAVLAPVALALAPLLLAAAALAAWLAAPVVLPLAAARLATGRCPELVHRLPRPAAGAVRTMAQAYAAGQRTGLRLLGVGPRRERRVPAGAARRRWTKLQHSTRLLSASPRELVPTGIAADVSDEERVRLCALHGDYDGARAAAAAAVRAARAAAGGGGPGALLAASPVLRRYCGARWRALFIALAAREPAALAAATRHPLGRLGRALLGLEDRRPARERVANRYLKVGGAKEWHLPTPPPPSAAVAAVAGGPPAAGVFADWPPAVLAAAGRTTVIFVPGLLNGLLPVRAFDPHLAQLERDLPGVRVVRARCHPLRGCEANVADLEEAFARGLGLRADKEPMEDDEAHEPENVVCVCYSKGMPDLLTFLVRRPQYCARVRAVFSWAGAIGGSPLANDVHAKLEQAGSGVKEMGQNVKGWFSPAAAGRPAAPGGAAAQASLLTSLPMLRWAQYNNKALAAGGGRRKRGDNFRLDEWDLVGAMESLSTPYREKFLEEHGDAIARWRFPVFRITGATTAAEVPFFQTSGYLQLCAWDANNDMQLTQDNASLGLGTEVPLAVVNGHHWDMSYPPFPSHMTLGSKALAHPFPKYSSLLAMVLLCVELELL